MYIQYRTLLLEAFVIKAECKIKVHVHGQHSEPSKSQTAVYYGSCKVRAYEPFHVTLHECNFSKSKHILLWSDGVLLKYLHDFVCILCHK